jgi:hypothetical protein
MTKAQPTDAVALLKADGLPKPPTPSFTGTKLA